MELIPRLLLLKWYYVVSQNNMLNMLFLNYTCINTCIKQYQIAAERSKPIHICLPEHIPMQWDFSPCNFLLSLQGWMTVCCSTLRRLRERRWEETSCFVSPTRSWRSWGSPASDTRSSSWRLWTYSVPWWVLHPFHSVISFPSRAGLQPVVTKLFFSYLVLSSGEW